MSRPPGDFDAERYFRGDHQLRFYNVGTTAVRALSKRIYVANRAAWTVHDAVALADDLIRDRYLEVKAVGIEVLALYNRFFVPRFLPVWKRRLARGDSGNWATTDSICGSLIGPLLVRHPTLAEELGRWSRHRSLWVRRASVVGLIPLARKGAALDVLYRNARALHRDRADLIEKAVGWALREAGKTDSSRLARYLKENGPAIPRTTVRYAIERFAPDEKAALLASTRKAP